MGELSCLHSRNSVIKFRTIWLALYRGICKLDRQKSSQTALLQVTEIQLEPV